MPGGNNSISGSPLFRKGFLDWILEINIASRLLLQAINELKLSQKNKYSFLKKSDIESGVAKHIWVLSNISRKYLVFLVMSTYLCWLGILNNLNCFTDLTFSKPFSYSFKNFSGFAKFKMVLLFILGISWLCLPLMRNKRNQTLKVY